MTNLIPIDDIPNLGNADFFTFYAEGKLNSLDVPASEYFERQEIIVQEVNIRVREQDKGLTMTYMLNAHRIEDVTTNYRPHLLAYQLEQGTVMEFAIFSSPEEVQLKIDTFKKTGELEIHNFPHMQTRKTYPVAVGYFVLQEMHRKTGTDVVSFVPKNP